MQPHRRRVNAQKRWLRGVARMAGRVHGGQGAWLAGCMAGRVHGFEVQGLAFCFGAGTTKIAEKAAPRRKER
jgi:hypothetical protein